MRVWADLGGSSAHACTRALGHLYVNATSLILTHLSQKLQYTTPRRCITYDEAVMDVSGTDAIKRRDRGGDSHCMPGT